MSVRYRLLQYPLAKDYYLVPYFLTWACRRVTASWLRTFGIGNVVVELQGQHVRPYPSVCMVNMVLPCEKYVDAYKGCFGMAVRVELCCNALSAIILRFNYDRASQRSVVVNRCCAIPRIRIKPNLFTFTHLPGKETSICVYNHEHWDSRRTIILFVVLNVLTWAFCLGV